MACCQKFCKGSVKRLIDGNIVNLSPHCHAPNDLENELFEVKQIFRSVLVQRAMNETTRLRDIYDEECVR